MKKYIKYSKYLRCRVKVNKVEGAINLQLQRKGTLGLWFNAGQFINIFLVEGMRPNFREGSYALGGLIEKWNTNEFNIKERIKVMFLEYELEEEEKKAKFKLIGEKIETLDDYGKD